jgi:hypothetical protein
MAPRRRKSLNINALQYKKMKINANMLAILYGLSYLVYMIEKNDSLARLAHATGMTDLEYEERQRILARIAHEEEQALLAEVDDEHVWEDHYEDIDYGYHDQYDF